VREKGEKHGIFINLLYNSGKMFILLLPETAAKAANDPNPISCLFIDGDVPKAGVCDAVNG
jgi:hypothetical protein